MAHAQCSCGSITLTLQEPSKLVIACHCLDCQRGTGAPFGVGAFYPADDVTITGIPKEYARIAASGGKVYSYFCTNCESTIYWKAERLPNLIGVAIGALADPIYGHPSDQSSSNRNISGFRLKAPTFSTSNKEARQKAQTKNRPWNIRFTMLAPFIIAVPECVVEDLAAGIGLQSAARQTATTVVDGKRALRVELPPH